MHQQLQKNPWPLVRPENYRSDTVGTTRNLGFLPTPETKRPLPPDLAEKPPPSILDRFRALLKQREDEDGESPATVDEIVWMYEEVLSELTFNSKPIITDLTIIAGEQKEHGEAIANAICSRILEVPVEQKLPSLYLLDSIIKNIGGYYVEYFAAWLPEVFCETYKQMNASLHPAMHRLFRTWSMVFPSSLLLQIESELQLSSPTSYQSSSFTMLRPSESSSSHQGDGIHVNLNYLEAWHHLEHSNVMPGADPTGNTTISDIEREGMEGAISVKPKGLSGASSKINDNQLENGVSSGGQIYGHKPSTGPVKYIFDHLECVSSSSGDARKGLQSELPLVASKNKLSSRLPPLEVVAARCLSPRGSQFARDIPHVGGLEGASWSPSVLTSEIRSERGGKWHDHWQKFWSDDDIHELESSTCSNSNLCNLKQPREFSKSASHDMHLVVDQPDVNSIDNKLTVPTWQNIEEDEYDWEDMSPTLADHNQGDDLQLFDFRIGNLSTACSSEGLNAAPEPAFQRSKLASHVQQSAVDEFDVNVEDKIAVQNPVHTGIQCKSFTQLPRSPYSRDPQHLLHDFQPREVDPQSPLSVNRIALSSEQQMPLRKKALDAYLPFQRSSEQKMPLGEKALDAYLPFQRPSTRIKSSSSEPTHVDSLLHMTSTSTLEKHMLLKQHLPPAAPTCTPSPKYCQPSFLPRLFQHKQVQRFDLLPLPLGPHPSSQVGRSSQTACSVYPHPLPRGTFSGLISSLMAKGLISLPQPATSQDSLGLEFDAEILKLRHESVINALYVDLPRQCTTCGLRFKFQGEHSRHMDWHVTKNQMSKNHKQNSSRKWFVGAKEWFSGAETLGTDAVPGFLPTEAIVEKREDEEIAVPADDNQCVCALCGDPFQDFYSDETEEWMYKGAVYLNAPDGSVGSSSRSQFGPIVHAKCRSESMAVSQDFPQDKGRNDEESSQRKKMRS